MGGKHECHSGNFLGERPQGQRVQWLSGKSTATGIVKERITENKTFEGNKVSASKDDPRFLVENDSTGTVTAGHRPDAFSKADSSDDVSSSSSDEFRSGEFRSGEFKQGDRVRWNAAQGKTTGTVKQKLTSETDINYAAKASEDAPQPSVSGGE